MGSEVAVIDVLHTVVKVREACEGLVVSAQLESWATMARRVLAVLGVSAADEAAAAHTASRTLYASVSSERDRPAVVDQAGVDFQRDRVAVRAQ